MGVEGKIKKGKCLRKGRRRDCPHVSSNPAVPPCGEDGVEVLVNSCGEAEAHRGADTGLRPTEMFQAGNRPQTVALRRPQDEQRGL